MADKRTKVAIGVSLVIALCATAGIYFGYKTLTNEVTVKVLVANKDLPSGTILESDMFDVKYVKEKELLPSYILVGQVSKEEQEVDESKTKMDETIMRTIDDLKGKEVLETVYKGEIFNVNRISGLKNALFEDEDGKELDMSKYRKMTYTADGIQNLQGQIKAGDKVDFWVRYKLSDVKKNDTIIVTEKILSGVPVLRTLDSNAQEIKDSNVPSNTIELLLEESEIPKYLEFKELGTITLVKSPTGVVSSESETERRITSINELTQDVVKDANKMLNDNSTNSLEKYDAADFIINSN